MAPSQLRSYWQFIVSLGAVAILLQGCGPWWLSMYLQTGLIGLNRLFSKKEKACRWEGHMYMCGGCREEWGKGVGGWDRYAQQTLCML